MPKPGDEPVEIDCIFRSRGANAVLIRIESREIWIPYVAVHEDNNFDYEDAARGDKGVLIIKQWLAEKEDLV